MADKAISDMLDNMIANKASDVQQNFNDIMQARTGEALDTLRQEKAQDVFNKHVVDPNMEPQGVSLDDALVDIDQTTGMPVAGETNGEDI
jgi:hypothetical protein